MKVFDKTGKDQILGDEIARGGEGVVYALAARPSVVVKLYHKDLLTRRGEHLRKKVESMLGMGTGFKDAPLAWPAISVHDKNGVWLGYAMKRVAVSYTHLTLPTNREV